MKKKDIAGKLCLLFATLIWGTSFFILKNAIDVFPTFFVLAVRFSLSAVLIGLIFIKKIIKIDKKAALHGAIIGLVVAGAYALQTVGLKYTTPSKNAFLTAVYVVLVPFLSWLFLRKKPYIKNVIAAVLCILGIGLVSINGDFTIGIGDFLTIISGIFYALQIVFTAKYASDDDPVQLVFTELAVVGAIFWIISLSVEKMPTGITFTSFLPILYLAFICTAVAQFCQMVGQKHTSSNSAAIILSLETVFGTLFSVIFYHEVLTLQLICGFAIIFIAVLLGEIDWKEVFDKLKGVKRGKKDKQKSVTDGNDGESSDDGENKKTDI